MVANVSLCYSGGASMKLQPEEQEVVGWDDDEELVIDEGKDLVLGMSYV